LGFVSFHEQWLGSTGPFRDVMVLMFATLAKQEAARISDKGRIKGCKSGREDNRAFHTLCTPVRASLASSRNDSGMPDTAKKPNQAQNAVTALCAEFGD
jgi:hypothetical protein